MLGGRSQDDLKGRESSISRHNDAQFRFSADLEQLTMVEVVDVADGYTTIGFFRTLRAKFTTHLRRRYWREMFSHSHKSSTRCFFWHKLPFTFAGFEIQHMASSEDLLTITARALSPTSACPSFQQASSHVHSYYTRSPPTHSDLDRDEALHWAIPRRFHQEHYGR